MAIDDEIDGVRPRWAQLCDIVERYCQGEETAEELRWLRAHPTDWLMAARYLRIHTESIIAKSRMNLKDIPAVDPDTGSPRREYLTAKHQMDKLNAKRLTWMEKLEDQIQEAKYIIGYDKISDDMQSQLVDRLVTLRTAVLSELFDKNEVLRMVDGLLRTYAPAFEPAQYRPRRQE